MHVYELTLTEYKGADVVESDWNDESSQTSGFDSPNGSRLGVTVGGTTAVVLAQGQVSDTSSIKDNISYVTDITHHGSKPEPGGGNWDGSVSIGPFELGGSSDTS